MIPEVFIGQDALDIRCDTNIDISGASDYFIKYRKPDGVEGTLNASFLSGYIVRFEVVKDQSPFDVVGIWKFWPYIVFSDGRKAAGKYAKVQVSGEGN